MVELGNSNGIVTVGKREADHAARSREGATSEDSIATSLDYIVESIEERHR